MSVKPISPSTVTKKVPDVIIEVFNALIREQWDGEQAHIKQDNAVREILKRDSSMTRGEIFAKGMLDVESLYESMGWVVEYDKPGYSETYGAYYVFRKKS